MDPAIACLLGPELVLRTRGGRSSCLPLPSLHRIAAHHLTSSLEVFRRSRPTVDPTGRDTGSRCVATLVLTPHPALVLSHPFALPSRRSRRRASRRQKDQVWPSSVRRRGTERPCPTARQSHEPALHRTSSRLSDPPPLSFVCPCPARDMRLRLRLSLKGSKGNERRFDLIGAALLRVRCEGDTT